MLGVFLNSINYTKKDIISEAGDSDYMIKKYPRFPIARTLSYFVDCILIVNEINIRGTKTYQVDNYQHYKFLLEMVSKRKRFSKWAKPIKYDAVDMIQKKYSVSYDKAIEYLALYNDEQLTLLEEEFNEGGKE